MMLKILLLIAFCFVLHTVLAATRCYQCSTATDVKCGNPFEAKSTMCIGPEDEEINCVKYIYEFKEKQYTYRGCRELNATCDDIKKAVEAKGKTLVDCDLCTVDLCNDN